MRDDPSEREKPDGRAGSDLALRAFGEADRPWARALLAERWGSHVIVTRGILHQADALDGFVAELRGERQGLATYRIGGDGCELVSLDSSAEGRGIGTALLEAVERAARARGCRRLWLVTTNDNGPALRFYHNRGFVISAVHEDSIAAYRALKPAIPENGIGGVPIRDEIELERRLG